MSDSTSNTATSTNGKQKADIQSLVDKATDAVNIFRRYSFLIFLVFVAALYGFILFRVSSLDSEQPSTTAVSSQVQAAQIPHINQSVVNQLQSLQDNSVSVQALFNQARSNPFQQ
jgi:hypothetical protein